MELKHIKELMTAMSRTGIKKLVLKKEDIELELERDILSKHEFVSPPEYLEDHSHRPESNFQRAAQALSRGSELSTLTQSESKAEDQSLYVTSPMVGTFYASPSPEDPSFVKIGDKIEKGTVVCIVEAMKVMNEVKAGISGTIAEILVENGHPIEFGTKLFRVTTG